jgi:N-acetylneuraminate synthase
MNPKTWCEMVDRTRELERALGTTEKKIEENERDSAIVQRRALYLTRPIGKGEVITADALAALRPAPLGSVTPNQRHLITGMLAPRNFQAGDCLRWIDWR